MRQRLQKGILLSLGVLSLALGILGIFLPLLPTTPFLLLSAFLFSKSNDRLHQWLLDHPVFGPPILGWQRHRVISIRAKIFSVSTILLGMVSVWLTFPAHLEIGKFATLAIMGSVLLFILTRKSHRSPPEKKIHAAK